MANKMSGNALAAQTLAGPKLNGEINATPVWGWGSVVCCLTIPYFSFGEALPAGVGMLGALGCYWFSRDAGAPTTVRIRQCWLTATISWAVYGAHVFRVNRFIEL